MQLSGTNRKEDSRWRLMSRDCRFPERPLAGSRGELVESLNQEAQEKSHVGDDADGFQGSTICELGDDGGVDIDADEADAGGRHIADADGVEHGGEHKDHFRALEKAGVIGLGLDQIHLGIRERTVIANGTGEGELHVVPDAFVEDAAGERALGYGGGDAAMAANRINSAQVMAVTSVDGDAPLQVHAQ